MQPFRHKQYSLEVGFAQPFHGVENRFDENRVAERALFIKKILRGNAQRINKAKQFIEGGL